MKRDAYRSALASIGGSLYLAIFLFGCDEDLRLPQSDATLVIDLRWIESYPRQRRSHVETGLLWTLSFLGAALPRDAPSPLSWRNDIVTLHLDRAGIDPAAWSYWRHLLDAMKASEEYRSMGAIDIGRFVALTLCSTRHYYALTGARARYEEARSEYTFDTQPVAIVESSVAMGNRIIELALGTTVGDIAFVAHEGSGSVVLGTFQIQEHELLEIMPNGQLRFALYDLNGSLKLAASDTLTSAGKPSKCLWCHETSLLKSFEGRTSVAGYHSPREFEDQLAIHTERLQRARAELNSMIDYTRAQDHTYAELLYLAFYEPSAERIAREWNLPVERVEEMLAGLPTHEHDEFAYLGESLYRRSQVDVLAPYDVIVVPTDPREPSAYEPDLLQ